MEHQKLWIRWRHITAQSRHRDKLSRSMQSSTEALATGQPEPPSSRPIQADRTADRSRSSGARESQRPETGELPQARTRKTTEASAARCAARKAHRPARPEQLPRSCLHAVPHHATPPSAVASSPTSPPAPTGAARAAATLSAAAANLGPPPPDADAPPRHRG
jgi:hypothetical protein